jgi:cytochrome b561
MLLHKAAVEATVLRAMWGVLAFRVATTLTLVGSTVPFIGVALGLGSVLGGLIIRTAGIPITRTIRIHTTHTTATRIGGFLVAPMFGVHLIHAIAAIPHNLKLQTRVLLQMRTESGTTLARVTTLRLRERIAFSHLRERMS